VAGLPAAGLVTIGERCDGGAPGFCAGIDVGAPDDGPAVRGAAAGGCPAVGAATAGAPAGRGAAGEATPGRIGAFTPGIAGGTVAGFTVEDTADGVA
jgi:hypothetical protein